MSSITSSVSGASVTNVQVSSTLDGSIGGFSTSVQASSTETGASGEPLSTITAILTEDDIPGAKLTEPIDRYTVPELKWWLICRSVQVQASWTKKQLVARYLEFFSQCILLDVSGLLLHDYFHLESVKE